jgi:hypothetical protein
VLLQTTLYYLTFLFRRTLWRLFQKRFAPNWIIYINIYFKHAAIVYVVDIIISYKLTISNFLFTFSKMIFIVVVNLVHVFNNVLKRIGKNVFHKKNNRRRWHSTLCFLEVSGSSLPLMVPYVCCVCLRIVVSKLILCCVFALFVFGLCPLCCRFFSGLSIFDCPIGIW